MPEAVGAVAARTMPAVSALHAHISGRMLGGRGAGGWTWYGSATVPEILVPETRTTALRAGRTSSGQPGGGGRCGCWG